MHACIYVYVCVYMYVYIYVCMHMYVKVCMYVYIVYAYSVMWTTLSLHKIATRYK